MDGSYSSQNYGITQLVHDIASDVEELHTLPQPITDNHEVFQHLCINLELLLRFDLKDFKLTGKRKKDYWEALNDCLISAKGLREGINYVKSSRRCKSSQANGRALIRHGLLHHQLADTVQICYMSSNIRKWYGMKSIWFNHNSMTQLLMSLYDINDLDFDIVPDVSGLDESWPTVARDMTICGSQEYVNEVTNGGQWTSHALYTVPNGQPVDTQYTVTDGSLVDIQCAVNDDQSYETPVVDVQSDVQPNNESSFLSQPQKSDNDLEISELKSRLTNVLEDHKYVTSHFHRQYYDLARKLQRLSDMFSNALDIRGDTVLSAVQLNKTPTAHDINGDLRKEVFQNSSLSVEELSQFSNLESKSGPRDTKVNYRVPDVLPDNVDPLLLDFELDRVLADFEIKCQQVNDLVLMSNSAIGQNHVGDLFNTCHHDSSHNEVIFCDRIESFVAEEDSVKIKEVDITVNTNESNYGGTRSELDVESVFSNNPLIDSELFYDANEDSEISSAVVDTVAFQKKDLGLFSNPESQIIKFSTSPEKVVSTAAFVDVSVQTDFVNTTSVSTDTHLLNTSSISTGTDLVSTASVGTGTDSIVHIQNGCLDLSKSDQMYTNTPERMQMDITNDVFCHMTITEPIESSLSVCTQTEHSCTIKFDDTFEATYNNGDNDNCDNDNFDKDYFELVNLCNKITKIASNFNFYQNRNVNNLQEKSSEGNSFVTAQLDSLLSHMNSTLKHLRFFENSTFHSNISPQELSTKHLDQTSHVLTSRRFKSDSDLYQRRADDSFLNISRSLEHSKRIIDEYDQKIVRYSTEIVESRTILSESEAIFDLRLEERDGKLRVLEEEVVKYMTELKQLREQFLSFVTAIRRSIAIDLSRDDLVDELEKILRYTNVPNLSQSPEVNINSRYIDPIVFNSSTKLDNHEDTSFFPEVFSLDNTLEEDEVDKEESLYHDCILESEYITTTQSCQKQDQFIDSLKSEIQGLRFELSTSHMQQEIMKQNYALHQDELYRLVKQISLQQTMFESLTIELDDLKASRESENSKHSTTMEQMTSALTNKEADRVEALLKREEIADLLEFNEQRYQILQTKYDSDIGQLRSTLSSKEQELQVLEEDALQLKRKLIHLIKEKDILWKRADSLVREKRLQAAEKWMLDTEVTQCMSCKSEFSFTLRKHHCRLCGKIFCWMCCSNWVMTTHSRKKSRVCNSCYLKNSHIDSCHVDVEGEGDSCDEDSSMDQQVWRQTLRAMSHSRARTITSSNRTSLSSSLNSLAISSISSADAKFSTSSPLFTRERLKSTPETHVQESSLCDNFDSSTKHKTVERSLSEDDIKIRHPVKRMMRAFSSLSSSPTISSSSVPVPCDDNFDVISDEEIARSLTLSRSPTHLSAIYATTSIAELREECFVKDVTVEPEREYLITIVVDCTNVILAWYFSCQPIDVGFGVVYCQTSETIALETLLDTRKCHAHEQQVEGELLAKKCGVYTLRFDNTLSKVTPLNIKLNLFCKE